MKTLKKFWGIALVVVMLTTLFLGTAAPASAANYVFSADLTQPSTINGVLLPTNIGGVVPMAIATYNIYATAQSGATVYAVIEDTASNNKLMKSLDGGNTWAACAGIGLTAATAGHQWKNVAVAPDDANFVVVIDDIGATDNVWVSQNGGITFSMLTAPAIAVINAVTVSPGASRMIAIGGVAVGGQVIQVWTIGTLAGAWANLGLPVAGEDGCSALQFSPNYAADLCLVAITYENGAGVGFADVNVYSFNGAPIAALGWNPVGYNFPRRIATDTGAGALAVNVASMALDANFYLGDESTQIGFIGAGITDSTPFEAGGVWRFDYAAAVNRPLTKILGTALAGTAINSVAWDGTNLIAAVLGAAGQQAISRSATALGAVPVFSPVTALKAPYGVNPIVYFNSGAAYCLTSVANGGVTKSTDLGKTWDGIALLATNFALVSDFWQSTDGTRSYYVVDDGTNCVVWRKSAGVWTRIAIVSVFGNTWLVRGDNDVTNTVYVGLKGANTLYKSLDGGATYTTRAAGGAIQDFAIQDANTVYVAVAATANVIKSTNGAFTWSAQTATGMATIAGGTCYSMNLIGDDKVIVGGTLGGVAYTADGNTTWTAIPARLAAGATTTIATASGLATGDTIWAGDATGVLGLWVIGTNLVVPGWTAGAFVAPAPAITSIDGLAYANGALFVLDSAGGLAKYLYPTGTFGFIAGQTDWTLDATVYAGGTSLNSLQYTTSTNTVLWARDFATGAMMSFTDYSVGPAQAPAPTAPINGAIAQINSINGAVNAFNFFWDGPAAVIAATPGIGYQYNLQVYLDEAGTIPVAGSATVVTSATPTFGVANTVAAAPAPIGFAGIPGTTYYWRVRVAADSPAQSYWSPMASFAVQQLQAIVPVLNSPANGFSVTAGMSPAFSWNPIASVTSYKFEVSTDPAFATTIYSTTTASAGAAIPSTVKLVAGTNYFWRVKTLTPAEGDWSAVSNFSIAAPVTTTVAPTVAPPTLTVILPPVTTTSIIIPPPTTTTNEVNPSYIWAIIIIGAVLVIAVIVLIVRTRRSV